MQPDRILKFSNLTAAAASTATSTARAVITIPERKVIGISVDNLAYITFSNAGTAADATALLLPAAGIYTFDTGHWTKLSIFSGAGAAVISSVFEVGN